MWLQWFQQARHLVALSCSLGEELWLVETEKVADRSHSGWAFLVGCLSCHRRSGTERLARYGFQCGQGEADAGRSEEVSPARGFGVDAAHRTDLGAYGVKVVQLALYCDQKTEIYRDSFRIESINPMAGENLSPAICFGEKWAPRFSKMKNRNFGKISLANFRIGGNVRAFHESL